MSYIQAVGPGIEPPGRAAWHPPPANASNRSVESDLRAGPRDALGLGPLSALTAGMGHRNLSQAVFAHPETVAYVAGYDHPAEDWPVADPFVPAPPLLLIAPGGAMLIVAEHYRRFVPSDCPVAISSYTSMTHARALDPRREFGQTFAAACAALGMTPGPTGIESVSTTVTVLDVMKEQGLIPVDAGEAAIATRERKAPTEVDRMRRAARVIDAAQHTMKDRAEVGMTELELAGVMTSAMWTRADRRVPTILWLTAGEASAAMGAEPTDRVLKAGDLVLNDVVCWFGGVWADSANAVVVGSPSAEQQRVFDGVRRALELAIDLCRPGSVARDIDRRVRESLADFGPTYNHHTGHGLGASWSEEPRINPFNDRCIEEDMIIAVEPAIYLPGWGGIRLEHTFVVRAGGNELLTSFEHTL